MYVIINFSALTVCSVTCPWRWLHCYLVADYDSTSGSLLLWFFTSIAVHDDGSNSMSLFKLTYEQERFFTSNPPMTTARIPCPYLGCVWTFACEGFLTWHISSGVHAKGRPRNHEPVQTSASPDTNHEVPPSPGIPDFHDHSQLPHSDTFNYHPFLTGTTV